MKRHRFKMKWLTEHPGAILHARTQTRFGKLICRVLGTWGCHDAINVIDWSNYPVIGEVSHPMARTVQYAKWMTLMDKGELEVKVLLPADYLRHDGMWASSHFMREIKNRSYDWWGIIVQLFWNLFCWSLLVRKLMGRRMNNKDAGLEWRNWCTEACRDCYLKPEQIQKDYWHKQNPTPRTTENRLEDGVFIDVTAEAIEVLP